MQWEFSDCAAPFLLVCNECIFEFLRIYVLYDREIFQFSSKFSLLYTRNAGKSMI